MAEIPGQGEQDGRLVSTWEMLYKDAEGEGHVVPLHKYDHTPEITPEQFISQAPPIKISPSRRARAEHQSDERIAGIGDIHFPFQDQEALDLALVSLKARDPSTIVLMGDNLDYAMFSRFETREEWAGSTQRGIDQYAEFLARLRADHPSNSTRIIWHEGNHDQRVEKQLRNYNGELLNVKRAGERLGALTLEFLTRAEELDVEVVKGYPTSRENHRGLLDTYHGNVTAGMSLAASKVIMRATTSFMTGHTHQLGIVGKTFEWRGEDVTIYGAEAGTYADLSKIPSGSYAPEQKQRQNWQRGVVNWDLYDEQELALPSIDHITEHGVQIDGKLYKS